MLRAVKSRAYNLNNGGICQAMVTDKNMKEKEINRKEKNPDIAKLAKRKRWIWGASFVSLLGASLTLVYLYTHRSGKELQTPRNIQEQYRQELPQLKKKAESGSAADLQNYAIAQYATGDAPGAEQTYRKQIEADPRSALAHNNLANALRDQGKYEEAAEHYEKAMEISPKMLSAYVNLGSIYQYSLKDKGKAAAVYERGIKNNPSSSDLHVLLAILQEQSGDKSGAADSYRRALEVNSANAAAKAALERMGQGETAESETAAEDKEEGEDGAEAEGGDAASAGEDK